MKINIEELLKNKLDLKLEYATKYDACYSNGTRSLYVNPMLFEFKNKVTDELLPVTTDIQLAVDLIRNEILNNEEYVLFSNYDVRKVVKINEKYQEPEV